MNNATTTSTPHVTISLRLRGSGIKKGKKTATRTSTRGTFDSLDTVDEMKRFGDFDELWDWCGIGEIVYVCGVLGVFGLFLWVVCWVCLVCG